MHPGYGFLSEKRGFRQRALSQGRHRLHRPDAAGHRRDGRQDRIEEAGAAKPASSPCPAISTSSPTPRRPSRIATGDRLSGDDQGLGRRRRQGHAHRRATTRRCAKASPRATNEAQSAFGDDRVFIEKYIDDPRHIEIQVLADAHGNVDPSGRARMLDPAPPPEGDRGGAEPFPRRQRPARRWASRPWPWPKRSDYRSAGTVEFIVDNKRNFYFLEMNTRLQVEHPVTELVTGLDLVELMIRIAAGEKLPITQKDVKLIGWAIEARIYAEDPLRNFLPSIGRLTRYLPPAGAGHPRRYRRLRRRRDLDVLRSDDRQAGAPAATRAIKRSRAWRAPWTPSTFAAFRTISGSWPRRLRGPNFIAARSRPISSPRNFPAASKARRCRPRSARKRSRLPRRRSASPPSGTRRSPVPLFPNAGSWSKATRAIRRGSCGVPKSSRWQVIPRARQW